MWRSTHVAAGLVVVGAGLVAGGALSADTGCVDYGDDYPLPVPVVGEVPGNGFCQDIDVVSGHAFVAGSLGLLVFDLADLDSPTFRGQTDGAVIGIAAGFPFTYALSQEDMGLQVIDVRQPTEPLVIDRIPTFGNPIDIVRSGKFLYTVDEWLDAGILVIWDLTEPTRPQPTGMFSGWFFSDLELRGPTAFLLENDYLSEQVWLLTVDVADPQAPQLLGQIVLPPDATAVVVAGEYAYVGTYENGIWVVDVSDLQAPVIVGQVPDVADARCFAVSGTTLFAFSAGESWPEGELLTLDLSSPASPVVVDRTATPQFVVKLDAQGNRVFSAMSRRGLRIFDASVPGQTTLLPWQRGVHDYCGGLAVVGQFATLVTVSDGLQVVDLTDPVKPALVAELPISGTRHSTCQDGTRLYWAGVRHAPSNSRVLDVVDLSTPMTPVVLGETPIPDYPLDLVAAGDRVYGTGQFVDLLVVDVSDPTSPAYVGSVDLAGGSCWSVAVAGTWAYVGTSGGIHTLDISDPDVPVPVHYLPVGNAVDLEIVGDIMYVASGGACVRVVDLVAPGEPVLLATLPIAGICRVVRHIAPYLYVGGQLADGLAVIDVTVPAAPYVVGVTAAGRPQTGMALGAGMLCITEGEYGFQIAPLHCVIVPVEDDLPPPRGGPTLAAYPNPFNPAVQLDYELDRAGHARVAVHDLAGGLLAVLRDGPETSGQHAVVWSGRDEMGRVLSSGTYLIVLTTERGSFTRKVSLVR